MGQTAAVSKHKNPATKLLCRRLIDQRQTITHDMIDDYIHVHCD